MPPLPASRASVPGVLLAAVVACGLSWLSFARFGHVHLNLADEGYLWYGVLRLLEGQVPFRDFQGYDPGRYVWCAAFVPLFGKGILGVRAAAAVFQALGLFLGILAAQRLARGRAWAATTVLFGVVLFLWMFPRHKLFEPAIAMALTWTLVRLLERPSAYRHLIAGLLVGLAGWFGRNHAVYGGLAALCVMGLLVWRQHEMGARRRWAFFGAGLVAGYAPLWMMLVVLPGFGESFLAELMTVAEKGTNVGRPYPWPWRVELAGLAGPEVLGVLVQALAFLLPPLVLGVGLWLVLRTPGEELAQRAVLVAGTIVGLFYVHHVSVRSDAPHLAQCIHPLLLALLALPAALGWRARARWTTWCAVALLSLLFALERHTSFRWLAPWRGAPVYVRQEVAGEGLDLLPVQATYLAALEARVARDLRAEDALLIVPSRPTLYCVLGRPSPVHQLYFLWTAPEEDQRALMAELERRNVDWVLVVDTAVDDRDELYFRNSHALVWRHLKKRFDRVPTPDLPRSNLLFRRRDG